MKVGDYAVGDWNGEVLIGVPVERKTPEDYIQSKQSGHLDSQLYSLSSSSPISYICIIGDLYGYCIQNDVNWNAMLSSLAGTSYRRSPDGCQGVVQVMQFNVVDDFCVFLKYLDEKVQKDEPRLPVFPKKVKMKPEERLVQILRGWPDVGEKTARSLLDRFNTIADFVKADPPELMTTEGVGINMAQKLWNINHMKWKLEE